ncbi:MAG: hypothetical protein AB1679_11365 [Actinomycetota bacterium]
MTIAVSGTARRADTRPAPAERAAELWRPFDVAVVYVAVVAVAGLIAAAWWGASGDADEGRQLGWLGLAIAADAVIGVIVAAWLIVGYRRLALRRRFLLAGAGVGSGAVRTAAPDGMFVRGARMSRYHRSGCHLVASREVVAAGAAEHEAAGCRPCPVCRPLEVLR